MPRSHFGAGLVVTLLVILSCSGEDTPANPPEVLTGVVTSVNVSPDRIPPNGAIQIRTSVVNFGPDLLVVDFETLARYGFEIDTPDTVISSPCDPDSGSSQLTLEPGAGRTFIMWFSAYRAWDFCPEQPDTLQVGTYTVRAGLFGHPDECPWGEASFEVISTVGSAGYSDGD